MTDAHPSPAATMPPPELRRLLGDLLRRLEPAPEPLAAWNRAAEAHYAPRARTTRLRTMQAVREAVALAPPGSSTLELTPELVARFAAASDAAGRRPATTNGLLRGLRAACNLAVARGWLGASPFAAARPWLDEGERRARHHSRKDICRVLESLRSGISGWEGHRLFALAATLSYTGLRRNEALRLRAEDVNLKLGFLRVRGRVGRGLKSAASRAMVPIPRALAAILRPWMRRAGSEWLFPGVKRLGPWTGGGQGRRAADRLKAAGEQLGVKGFTPHSLRHSLATHLRVFWGLGGKQVQMLLRHSGESTSEWYVGDELEDLAALVRNFRFDSATPPRRGRRSA